MRVYLAYFKIRFMNAIQYKVAALAGIATQFAWGFMYIMLYTAFMESGGTDMSMPQMATYIWLNQAFLCLFFVTVVDNDTMEQVRTGNIAIELVKPVSIYTIWHAKTFGKRVAMTLLRCVPIILVCSLMPLGKYRLCMPASTSSFIFFLITLILGAILAVSYIMLMFATMMRTVSSSGIKQTFHIVADFLGGQVIPVMLMPEAVIRIVKCTPFYYMQTTPFNIYNGYISDTKEILTCIFFQIFWIVIFSVISKALIKHQTNKIVVQGG